MSLHQLQDVLGIAARELGATTRAGYFDIARDAADAVSKGDFVDTQICLSPGTTHLSNKLQKLLGGKAQIVDDIGKARLTDKFILPARLVAIVEPFEIRDAEILPENARWIVGMGEGRRCCLFVVANAEEFEADEALRGKLEALGRLETRAATEDEIAAAIAAYLDESPDDSVKAATEMSTTRMARYAHEIISDEMRALELRKQLLTEDLNSVRRPGAVGSTDSNNRIRTLIQKNLQDAERAFKLKYDELNRNKRDRKSVV